MQYKPIRVTMTFTQGNSGKRIMDFLSRRQLNEFGIDDGLIIQERIIDYLKANLPFIEPEEIQETKKKCPIKKNISKKKIPSPNALNAGF